jgi:hypothetical protein
MGFCSDAEYWEFLRSVPEFERMLARSGIQLVKSDSRPGSIGMFASRRAS